MDSIKHAVIKQIDQQLEQLVPLKGLLLPQKAWIKVIRTALGMSLLEFAKRLGVNSPRVVQLEKDEPRGSVTLKTLRKAAEALNCQFVYAFIPNASIKKMIREQATKIATQRLNRVFHTMALEAQSVSEQTKEEQIEMEIKRLIETLPKDLWNNET